jgi:CHAT domain-containing protein
LAPFDAQRANALYQKIIAPAASVLDGAHALFVVPDSALQSLPFEVLVTQPPLANPEHLADHRDIAWLMRDYALTVLPSVGSLRALRQFTSAGRGTLPFVGIGDPVLQGSPGGARGVKEAELFRGRVADVDEVRMLPPLPETADELRAVARDLGAADDDLYLAERASEPLLRQAGLDRYRVVEFATHGLMSGDIAGLAEPALVLTPPKEASPDNDGLLTASKIATLKLDADWVVLSACNTAAADGTPDAEGLSGLAKAFFYAGARSILVSHWSVASEPTVKLITGAFAELQKDPEIGRAEALRRAEMAMLGSENPPEFAHPLVWAPFVLAGEGGAGR